MKTDDYLAYLASGTDALVSDAADAGLDAPVPTCPGWTVADLVGHQGSVHRWATAIVAGALPSTDLDPDAEAALAPPEDQGALLGWLADGAAALGKALRAAPEDLSAAVFLHDAPPPRVFWARRQAHETTIHHVDALAASRGRFPIVAETHIGPELAADGLDELLVGFVNRRSSRLRSAEPLTILVAPTDVDDCWTIAVSDDHPVTTPGADPERPADVVLSGTAAALYLGLWNRGDEVAQTGPVDALGLWRDKVRVTWG